ncbi:U6 small nuclear RNA (adenine-(43)-N(6))-methyltransferase [Battus philenor]|uniref:U6 small nuclear RNA (adenine-(43)-N(6))-methyltransferase n=1 Tax=Battus philenor TaxID=42288 RepID=UPI0035D08366
MALNKFMHPRNIYKTPPDFSKLYKTYEEFSSIAKMDITGKITIDFKDTRALRILTKCLLKSDFGLNVVIPENRLVPTLPLRLNYVLWIEDLMMSIQKTNITGLDIGTGACAIYPLLIATKNKWSMVATEKDDESLEKARENVEINSLKDLIKVQKNTTSSLIEHLFLAETDLKFDFCMCNPPFYSNIQDLWESRSPARPPPKNGFTGAPQELITEGGELEFCRRLINESENYRNSISIFTTMIGHKYNMKELVLDLKAKGIKYTTTEFCQGRVTRWGLAWTYQEYDLHSLVPPRHKDKKKHVPITCVLPTVQDQSYEVENVTEKIKTIFSCLNIDYDQMTKKRNEVIINFVGLNNTWSNQRRKRRLLKRLAEPEIKKQKLEYQDGNERTSEVSQTQTEEKSNLLCETKSDNGNEHSALVNGGKPIIQGIIKIYKKQNKLILEMEYLDGSAGKDGIHQILQYIKNNWKYMIVLIK